MLKKKPYLIKEISVFALLSFIVLVFLLSQLPFLSYLYSGFSADVLSAVLVELANEDRVDNELQPLLVNSLLAEAAESKALDMVEKGYFAHVSPEGEKPWDWIDQSGYEFLSAGENLAVGFFESEEVEEAWMNSVTHKANILNEKFSEIGIGIATGTYQGTEAVFVVQMFGKPKAKIAVASVVSLPEAIATPEVVEAQPEVLGESVERISAVKKVLASPRKTGSWILIILGALILFSIISLVWEGTHKHHSRHIIYASVLLVVVAIFIWLNQSMIFAEVIVL